MGYCPLKNQNTYAKKYVEFITREDAMQTRIKEYRSRLSMTQDDLAKAVGVRRETIVFLEQGKYNPSLKLAHDVARTLHAGIDELFIFEDDPRAAISHEILVD